MITIYLHFLNVFWLPAKANILNWRLNRFSQIHQKTARVPRFLLEWFFFVWLGLTGYAGSSRWFQTIFVLGFSEVLFGFFAGVVLVIQIECYFLFTAFGLGRRVMLLCIGFDWFQNPWILGTPFLAFIQPFLVKYVSSLFCVLAPDILIESLMLMMLKVTLFAPYLVV